MASEDKQTQKRKRREIAKAIINRSNAKHNESVLNKTCSGNLIPVRKTKNKPNFESHVSCSGCGGVISKKYFYAHKDKCTKRQFILENTVTGTPCSKFLAPNLDAKFSFLQSKVIENMTKDKIRAVVQKDLLILEYGRRFLKSHIEDHQRNYVACKMRSLADLVLRMSRLDPQVTMLQHCLDPSNFDTLCETVKNWSDYDADAGVCGVPSVPRRLVKTLKSCSEIMWCEAIKNKDLSLNEQLEIKTKHKKFVSLLDTDWRMELGCVGDNSLRMKKSLEDATMPTENDLKQFFSSISKEMLDAHTAFQKSVTEHNYNKLTKIVVAFLIAFNSRRPSEVTNAKLSDFLKIKSSNESLSIFTVTAPKNKMKVPIMVPKNVLKCINNLVKNRETVKINSLLLFCKLDGSAYVGTNILRSFVAKMKLENPKHFTANGLRHYWATNSQSNPELKKHMPKFLGHTLETHQKFYEMPMSNIYLDVMGPIFEEHCLPGEPAETNNFEMNEADYCNNSEKPNVDHGKDRNLSLIKTGTFSLIQQPSVSPKKLRKRPVKQVAVQQTTSSPSKDKELGVVSSPDDTDEDPDFILTTGNETPPKNFAQMKRRTNLEAIQSSSSDSEDSLALSTPPIKKKARWITPEKEEMYDKLGRVVLGLSPAKRGQVREVHENSKIIKERHSLQMFRIEVSKYRTQKKVVPSPQRKRIMATNSSSS